MMGSTDMSTPVTRGELQEVLSQVQQDHWRDLREATASLATKAELDAAIAPLATKAELDAAIAPLVTKAELHQEIQDAIAPLATKDAIAQLATKDAIAQLATKDAVAQLAGELELWGGAVVARFEHAEKRLDNLERGQEQLIGLVQQTQQQIQQTEQRLLAELARHTSAFQEATRTQIKASTEPFDDLPGRVSRLENEVFGPASRDRRRRRRSD